MSLQATGSQTVGPYFSIGFEPLYRRDIAGPRAQGERIRVRGRIYDGNGAPVPDAMLEIWQANAAGRYNHPEDSGGPPLDAEFLGFGRIATDAEGGFEFTTVKPGRVAGPGGKPQAPHLLLSVFMRGILKRAVTRVYFDGDTANAEDFVLARVPPPRRATLLAQAEGEGAWRWDVHMQGERETVFFAV
jgi:protocatechuate 3,4-dioxygenase alpha subunit